VIQLSKENILESIFDVKKPVNTYGSFSLDGNTENNFSIVIQDHSEKLSDHDIKLKAISSLTDSIDFKFLQDDPNIQDKTYIILLDVIGSLMKTESSIGNDQISNLDMVKAYIDDIIVNK
jgi:hypothetical protein